MIKLVLTAVLLMCTQLAMAFSYTLEISEDELQSRVSAMMPMEKKKFFITVVLSDPDIDLSVGNNEIGIFSHIEVSAPGGIKGSGTAKITGSLSYDPDKGEFFFKDPDIVSFESKDIPPEFLPKAKNIAQIAADQFLSVKPVYKLNDNNMKQKLAKAVLQSVKVDGNQLLVELSVF